MNVGKQRGLIWEEKEDIRAVFIYQKSYIKKGENLFLFFIERDGIGPNGGHSKKEDLGSQLGSIF